MQQNANKRDSENKRWEVHSVSVYHLFVFISQDNLPCVTAIQRHEAQNRSMRVSVFCWMNVPCASTAPHLRQASVQHCEGILHTYRAEPRIQSKSKQTKKAKLLGPLSRTRDVCSVLSQRQHSSPLCTSVWTCKTEQQDFLSPVWSQTIHQKEIQIHSTKGVGST